MKKSFVGFMFFSLLSTCAGVIAGNVMSVDTISDMLKIDKMTNGDVVIVSGYMTVSDGGGGTFRWDSAKMNNEDNGIIFKSAKAESGRWIRIFDEQSPVNVRWYGVWGDGKHDDSARIQKAIYIARSSGRGVYFPKGDYVSEKPLDFTRWFGILVKGEDPGNSGISGDFGVSRLLFRDVNSVGADFSGSSYGTIKNLAFASIGNVRPKASVLIARGEAGYGSDVTFSNCNFASGTLASIFCFSGEVLTFNDCRINCGGLGGLIITGMKDYDIASPFPNCKFASGISLTTFRIVGGEFTTGAAPAIVLDGRNYTLADVWVAGTFFSLVGPNSCVVKLQGNCSNITFEGHRAEVPVPLPANLGFARLDDAEVRALSIRGKVTKGPIVYGYGIVEGSQFLSSDYIDLNGDLINCDVMISKPGEANYGRLPVTTITGKATGTIFHLYDESLRDTHIKILNKDLGLKGHTRINE